MVWRLLSDRDILAFEKSPLPLCELLRKLTVEQGLVDIDVEFHVLANKMHPAKVSLIPLVYLVFCCAFFLPVCGYAACLARLSLRVHCEADAEALPVSFRWFDYF